MKLGKKIICTILFLYIVLNETFIINAFASENLPEVTVKVSNTGVKTVENIGDVKKGENVLTRVSETLLKGDSMYTSDSKMDNNLHGTKPGKVITGNMGCTLKDEKGNKITKLEVTGQLFINTDKSSVADILYSSFNDKYGFDNPSYKEVLKNADNLLSSTYGTYLEKEYKIEITFNDNGEFAVKIPEDVPDNYILAFTKMVDPVTGKEIELTKYFRLFLALGDASNSDPGNNPNKPNEDLKENEDDGKRYYSVSSDRKKYTDLEPEISSQIRSDIYDVETAIPTSENLKWQITADNALYDIETRKTVLNAGVKDITIKLVATYPQRHTRVYYNKLGKKVVKRWTTIESVERTVTTNYSYDMPDLIVHDVPKSNIYPVVNGNLKADNNGNILNSGTISLTGSETKASQKLGFFAKKPSVSDVEYGDLGYFSSKSSAVSAINNDSGEGVKNRIRSAVHSSVGYLGGINYAYYGLNVTTFNNNGVKPVVAKTSNSTTNIIKETYPNGLYNSSGNVMYSGAQNFGTKPNNVIVHTPVVNKAYISWVSDFINQKITKNSKYKYLMLDEEFTVTIPDDGTHNNFKGYGKRKYNSNQGVNKNKTTWGKIKDVKLPFDSYLHIKNNSKTNKYFIKANTWLSESVVKDKIDLTKNSYTFTIPVWVVEKTYDIETRVIAENTTNNNLVEEGLNSSILNYVATKKIPVEIIGKIYDLRVSASNDPGWKNQILSNKTKNEYIMADEFPFGQKGQNKIPQYKYAPKLGYTFIFDFKTKGRKSNNIGINVQPEGFYFVSKDGKETKEVDLYYDTVSKKNIFINTKDNNFDLKVKLKDEFLKVSAQEFIDSDRIYKTEINKKYNYNIPVNIGKLSNLKLPHDLRLCYNNFSEYVNKLYGINSTEKTISKDAETRDNVIGSVGHWYAGYKLPVTTKVVEKGENIEEAIRNKAILKDGYILVKFDIKTKYQNKTGNYDYLQYKGPEALNEGKLIFDWTKEEKQEIVLPNGNKAKVPVGTVAIYEASLTSGNDVDMGGTH